MQIRKYRHSCLHVLDGDASIVIDPGSYSTGYDSLTGLTAVLITHAHADHLDPEGLARMLRANPQAGVFVNSASGALLAKHPATADIAVTAVGPGDVLNVGTRVRVSGGDHAVIHADLPIAPNLGYLIGDRLFHPGDALAVPSRPVEVLALPVSAPWMAVKEAVDYLRRMAPARAIPIHEAGLSGTATVYGILSSLAPAGTQWTDLDDGTTLEI